jgi:serine protease Do
MKIKNILKTMVIAIFGGLIAVFAYSKLMPDQERIVKTVIEQPVGFAKLVDGGETAVNFVPAAQSSIEAVVHVKTETNKEAYNPLLEFFYGDRYRQTQPLVGFGSGVIITNDGYIVTNNHVVEGSDQISVTLNDKREFKAKLIGTDPSTDIALLKIEGNDFHFIPWGNSDNLMVGEWVLAVGNPFNLTSTVTAGIVSAKGKNIGIIQDQYRMESFIQTDAAVNRGNSGGALVNISGELVGINTAILSPSGGYAGISFAIPVGIVQKVVKDLIEFGTVQRAILGVSIQDITAELAKEKSLEKIEGVYISGVRDDGAAKLAGIQEGDVIIKINDVFVNSSSELQVQVSKYSPNDKVKVELKRNGKTKLFDVTLRNLQGSTEVVKLDEYNDLLGARFAELTNNDKAELGIKYGVKVAKLSAGKLRAEGVREGFVITKINNQQVNSISQLKKVVNSTNGGVYIEGVYPDGIIAYYAFGLK